MTATVVDARFAGGAVVVERDDEYTGDGRPGVRLELPGHSLWLFAHEARALAKALAEHAATAEKKDARRGGETSTGDDQISETRN